ncbi:MAG: thioredoxin domain-containing protein [Pseudolabrys sp.]|nr:thioredoxin domain-containing protein [Pseudolabrys sp.]MDP2298341.1 thioredoxin domain-containing protein [Pseudolabrys sp.]
MPNFLRLIVAVFALWAGSMAAQADVGEFPIKADDGTVIANHAVAADLVASIEKLQNIVVAANPQGKVTLYEFYDLNCPYCRKASADIDELVRANANLRLVLVPFPVLGIPSILAARVEYAVNKLATPQDAYKFHRAVYESRGTIEDSRAFAAAQKIGLDVVEVRAKASEEAFARIMKEHLRIGDALGIQATPGLVIGGVAIVGYPGKTALAKVIGAVEKCGKVVC